MRIGWRERRVVGAELGVQIGIRERVLARLWMPPQIWLEPNWYAHQIGQESMSRRRAWRHYVKVGWQQGHDPCPFFRSDWYLQQNPHVADSGLNPLFHFLRHGEQEGRAPHPLVDPVYYQTAEPFLPAGEHCVGNRFTRYLRFGFRAGGDPHPAFQNDWYIDRHPDVCDSRQVPLVHYLTVGAQTGCWPNELFDPAYYIQQAPSLAADVGAMRNPLLHYLLYGASQGRNPHPGFDTNWYLMSNPDVAAVGMNPLVHYLVAGRSEGREPTGEFSTRWFMVQSLQGSRREGAAAVDFLARSSAAGLTDAKATRASQATHRLREFLASSERLALPDSTSPDVTVVIVVWNQAHFTLECLESLAKSSVPVRTVVVDNGSTDETAELLGRVDGIAIVLNNTNIGFLEAANEGLIASTTAFTLLLNNDATVTPDAIERALETARAPSIGAVAARIVLPNGLLQEARSFLWQGGGAQGYLRSQPVSIGASMHRRDVDFGSGHSCCCVRRWRRP